jgi:arsenite methyltransferase
MHDYLNYKFEDTERFVNTFDEMPLWSASFGLLLFKHLKLAPNLTVLDIGSGAGFPLLELAQRLGKSSNCFGLDPWVNANKRGNEKIKNYGVTNASVIEGSADKIPFGDNSIDLIVSNLGINNFEQPEKVFDECYRVLKPGGRLALTTNLNGHWQEFYDVFADTLVQTGNAKLLSDLTSHQEHRGTVTSISQLFTNAGFNAIVHHTDEFKMEFLDGTAFLNHYFIKLGWLASWKALIPEDQIRSFFPILEENLNKLASLTGTLSLTVPMAFIQAEKQ